MLRVFQVAMVSLFWLSYAYACSICQSVVVLSTPSLHHGRKSAAICAEVHRFCSFIPEWSRESDRAKEMLQTHWKLCDSKPLFCQFKIMYNHKPFVWTAHFVHSMYDKQQSYSLLLQLEENVTWLWYFHYNSSLVFKAINDQKGTSKSDNVAQLLSRMMFGTVQNSPI